MLEYRHPKLQKRMEEIQLSMDSGIVVMDESNNEFKAFSALDVLQIELAVII